MNLNLVMKGKKMIIKRFDICKSYFFILPSIQIITNPILIHRDTKYKFGIDIDWLCFHFSITVRRN